MAIIISPIRETETGAFEWTVIDPSYSPEPQRCNTNDAGYGLWRDGRQLLGLSQFDLNCSASARRARVVAFFKD